MDPVDKINIDKDTTFVLMLEAQRRGHEVYFMELDDLFIRGGTPVRPLSTPGAGARDAALSDSGKPMLSTLRTSIPCGCAKIRPSI